MSALVADTLRRFGACSDSIEWVGARKDARRAWLACDRGDWLLWIAARAGVDRRLVVRAACACARTALRYVPDGEDCPRVAIETAERWTRGKATLDEVVTTLGTSAGAFAFLAASAVIRSNVLDASDSAAAAAYTASAYASIGAAEDVRAKFLARHAQIVRRIIPWSAVRDAMRSAS